MLVLDSNPLLALSSLAVVIIPSVSAAAVSSIPAQTFLGIGGSGAWWPMDVYHFPEASRQQLSNLLFSQDGLGLSSYRWNIGAGGVNVSNPTRAPETFYVSSGVYNWAADAQGVYFMQEANKRGVEITAFANSAPAPLTSGRASCNSGFATGSGNAYGTFLADVLQHFVQQGIDIKYISPMNEPDSSFGPSPCGQEGMQVLPNQYVSLALFCSVSIFYHRLFFIHLYIAVSSHTAKNDYCGSELRAVFLYTSSHIIWESVLDVFRLAHHLLFFFSHRRAEVINGVWNALSARGLAQRIGIIADESSQLSQATGEYGSWLSQVADKVAALAHHTYDFPSDASYLSYVTNTARLFPGKKTWMTEICCSMGQADGTGRGYSQGYDPTITGALMFSGMVFQSLVTVNETHYDFWTLVSKEIGCNPLTSGCATKSNNQGWNDGVIYYDGNYAKNGNYQFYITKHYWAYKHFGNFVKPGMQRLPVTSLSSSESVLKNYILIASSSTQFNVIVMNPSSSATTLTLTFPTRACATSAFRTSASQDFASVGLPSSSNGVWTMTLPATTLTTFVFNKSC
jgi:O-glycosyl hydrolase